MTNAFTSLAEKMLADYNNLPRDAKLSQEQMEQENKEIRSRISGNSDLLVQQERSAAEIALQEMRELLDFVEKKVTGKLTDQDKEYVKQKADQWMKSIDILQKSLLE